MLLKSKIFLLVTLVFLIILGAMLTLVYPPLVTKFNANREQLTVLSEQVNQEEQFSRAISQFQKQQPQVSALNDKATLALPIKPETELLLLQLEGLVKSLNLPSTSFSIPFAQTNAAGQKTEVAVTMNGIMNYQQTRTLLIGLREFIRWNRVTSVVIKQEPTGTATTIGLTVYYKPGSSQVFSGNAKLIEEANQLFSQYKSYATAPDVKTEGTFGREDPLQPVR